MVVDYSDDYIQMISSNMDKNSYNSISNLFMQARGYCSEWTYKTSELAMDITNDDHSGNAMSSFYAMTFLWLFVSFIPMTVLGIKCYRYAQSFEPAPSTVSLAAAAPVQAAQGGSMCKDGVDPRKVFDNAKSCEEVNTNYKEAVLKCHPDKEVDTEKKKVLEKAFRDLTESKDSATNRLSCAKM
jgi:hypothetical protein